VELTGEWLPLEGSFSKLKGDFVSWYVPTDQPLQALLFHLLEPESLDGAVAWGLVELPDGPLTLPIFRVPQK
jgi:hypothetical protein